MKMQSKYASLPLIVVQMVHSDMMCDELLSCIDD